jgi:hypothetical protein
MTENKNNNNVYLIIGVVSLIGLIGSLYYYRQQKKKEAEQKLIAASTGEPVKSSSGIWIIVIIVLFLIALIAAFGFSIYSTTRRYRIAEEAIKQGNTGVGVAALSPEISMGINAGMRGFGSLFR